jgi:hypothetical protein
VHGQDLTSSLECQYAIFTGLGIECRLHGCRAPGQFQTQFQMVAYAADQQMGRKCPLTMTPVADLLAPSANKRKWICLIDPNLGRSAPRLRRLAPCLALQLAQTLVMVLALN